MGGIEGLQELLAFGDSFTLNMGIAFLAGLLSFFAPCVTVLVPAFLSHLAGVGLSDKEEIEKNRLNILYNTIFFILGFTVVFTILGAALGAVTSFFRDFRIWISRVGGVLIIYFGLATLKLVPNPFGGSGAHLSAKAKSPVKFVSSFIVGSTFAIGWSSCVGPILAAIFVLAGASASPATGVILLLAYSLGLMIPFLLVGIFTTRASNFLIAHSKLIDRINMAGGVILIALGILVFTDTFSVLVGYLYFLSPFGV